MRKNLFVYLLIVFIFTGFNSYLAATDLGRYAILIHGGANVDKDPLINLEMVQHELVPLFNTLVNKYNFANNDIYVLNLNGQHNSSSFYNYFPTSPTNYSIASPDNIQNTMQNLNIKLQNNNSNLVLVFMSGHRGAWPEEFLQYYRGYNNDRFSDEDFSEWVADDLLDGVNNKTKIVFITGFCSSYGFYNQSGSPFPELKDVCNTISFAAAHNVIGDGDEIRTEPAHSFMKYWVDAMTETGIERSFDDAFTEARSDMIAYWLEHGWSSLLNNPIKQENPINWDSGWNLNGEILPLNAWISGPTALGPGQAGTWIANYSGGSGAVSYQWWKKIGSGSWNSIGGNNSSISTTMGTQDLTLKVRVTRGNEYVEDIQYVNYLDPSLNAWITGPSYIPYKEFGTFEAHYSGGSGSVSYRWRRKNDGGSWVILPYTTASIVQRGNRKDFTLELRVTRGAASDIATKNVYGIIEPKMKGDNFSAQRIIPDKHYLYQNYPNPFNPETRISFDLPEDANVKINIYDTSGRLVSNLVSGFYSAGHHSASFNASSLSSGIYIYIIETGSFKQIQKMTLIK